MKRAGLFIILFVPLLAGAQDKIIDSTAVSLLDHMSNVIGDMKACSFKVNTGYDSLDQRLGFLKHHNESQVYLSGPSRMLVLSTSEKGRAGMWYNGKQLAFYSFTNNHYGYMEAPADNTIDAIDQVHEKYGVDFPASDFFYPTFTDDLISCSDRLELLGKVNLNGIECFHIASKSKNTGIQLWIRNDAFHLPVKMVITEYQPGGGRQFEGTYSDWVINPELPNAMFDFTPPPASSRITIIPAR